MFGLELYMTILLLICLFCALAFEFINGFHDTANAVATVIYTNSLKPMPAVVWSGLWNAVGVSVGGISVAMGIINLLPMDLLLDQDIHHNLALILSILFTAIIWNLGTWYYAIPCSSSHTLIGSILGAGLAFSLLSRGNADSVNWGKAGEIGSSLLLSPLLGFGLTILMMFVLKMVFKPSNAIFHEPPKNQPPSFWVRTVLILTCTGVSYSHGSNDGQKGVGLIMLILISIVPFSFALDETRKPKELETQLVQIRKISSDIDQNTLSNYERTELVRLQSETDKMVSYLKNAKDMNDVPDSLRFSFRRDILVMSKFLNNASENGALELHNGEKEALKANLAEVRSYTNYAPKWVTIMVALALGTGTMVGWKRIVVTIGEKIGKSHLTYAQGASAELVAASTIGLASGLGMPVSTTQVLSSGIAGSMVASNGLKNLQASTVRNMMIAWLLTFPVCLSLAALLFTIMRFLF